jgi:F-type H+-transporting ATPase subunit epsilon
MTALREGVVTVVNGSQSRAFQIHGGFADVTAQGLTILAEHAVEASV